MRGKEVKNIDDLVSSVSLLQLPSSILSIFTLESGAFEVLMLVIFLNSSDLSSKDKDY